MTHGLNYKECVYISTSVCLYVCVCVCAHTHVYMSVIANVNESLCGYFISHTLRIGPPSPSPDHPYKHGSIFPACKQIGSGARGLPNTPPPRRTGELITRLNSRATGNGSPKGPGRTQERGNKDCDSEAVGVHTHTHTRTHTRARAQARLHAGTHTHTHPQTQTHTRTHRRRKYN